MPSLLMKSTQAFFDLEHKSKAPVSILLGRTQNRMAYFDLRSPRARSSSAD
jgi:hypothetical protein